MVLPLFCEELANIKAFRAVTAVHPDVSFQENLSIKHNALFLRNDQVIDFNAIHVTVDPRIITVSAQPQDNGALIPYEVKLAMIGTKCSNNTGDEDDLKTWWPVKDLETKQALVCRACDALLVDTTSFKFKPLPSEHWYELVECWICHESKPEEHRARMQPISARPKMLLAGTTYVLVHPKDLASGSLEMDKHAASQLKWTMSRQWISVHCTKCDSHAGEGQFEKGTDGNTTLLGVKLYKYSVSPIPREPVLPTFMDFLTFDLLDAVKAHATYRFIIQSRGNSKVQLLLWMFSWNTKIAYNQGFTGTPSPQINHKKVMKVLYLDCTDPNSEATKHLEMWSKDKTADHLIYPESCCKLVLDTLKQSTQVLPPYMRIVNNPAMAAQHNFSIGFLDRG